MYTARGWVCKFWISDTRSTRILRAVPIYDITDRPRRTETRPILTTIHQTPINVLYNFVDLLAHVIVKFIVKKNFFKKIGTGTPFFLWCSCYYKVVTKSGGN
jgi:hypothetical protein